MSELRLDWRRTPQGVLEAVVVAPDRLGPHPALVLFHGGAWRKGSPQQMLPFCRRAAGLGMVAIAPEYRLGGRHGTHPVVAVEDALAAIAWTVANAEALGVDPGRIAAGGGSAGGHLALCATLLDRLPGPEPRDLVGVTRPCALVLFNPVCDTGPAGYGAEAVAPWSAELSPLRLVREGVPPAIVFHGRADRTTPIANARALAEAWHGRGGRLDLVEFDGEDHGFFNPRPDGGGRSAEVLDGMAGFLVRAGLACPTALEAAGGHAASPR